MSRLSRVVVQRNAVNINFLLTVFLEDDGIPFIHITDTRNV
jgi:hypothetical protein